MLYFSIHGDRPPSRWLPTGPLPEPGIWATVLMLALTTLIMVWLRHTGLDTYWQQTHHRESGLETFAASPVGQWGAHLDQQIQTPVSRMQNYVQQLDGQMVKASNEWISELSGLKSESRPAPGKPGLALVKTDKLSTVPVRAGMTGVAGVQGVQGVQGLSGVIASSKRRLPNGKIILSSQDRVLFIGDSMMQGVAPQAIRTLQRNYGIASVDASKSSTGLAYPRYFDWPKTVQELIPKHQITTLVVFIGANDTWDMVLNGRYEPLGTPRWRAMYASRIREILAYAREKQVEVIWLGDPAMGREKMNAGIPILNSLYSSVAAEFGIIYAPTDNVIGAGNGRYEKFVLDGDRKVAMRTNDGVHFTPAGQTRIAELILQQFHLPKLVAAK
jgi:uncharacterized protein